MDRILGAGGPRSEQVDAAPKGYVEGPVWWLPETFRRENGAKPRRASNSDFALLGGRLHMWGLSLAGGGSNKEGFARLHMNQNLNIQFVVYTVYPGEGPRKRGRCKQVWVFGRA